MSESKLIYRLLLSEEYRALQQLQPEFNLFSLLDDALREPAWSRIFAGLLDSTLPHKLGAAALCEWLVLVAAEARTSGSPVPPFLATFSKESLSRVSVEYLTPAGRSIDILVRNLDSRHRTVAVIGIENKLGSPEQPAQIADYQAALTEVFPEAQRLIVYLTPDRRDARTASTLADCPCLPASYRTLVGMCRKLAVGAPPQVQLLLDSLSLEVEAAVLGEDRMKNEAASLINRLWRDPDHRKALRLIYECIPTPRKVWETQLARRIQAGFARVGMPLDDDSIIYYPDRSASPREIQVQCGGRLGERTERLGFHFCYMLHCRDKDPDVGSEFCLRLMALCDSARARQRLRALSLDHSLPTSGDRKSWYKWENVWTGKSHLLMDLGARDITGLASILLDGVRRTYPIIAKTVAGAGR